MSLSTRNDEEPPEFIDGVSGYMIRKNYDEQGAVVGGYLVDSLTGAQVFAIDHVDYVLLTQTLPPHLRQDRIMSSFGGYQHGHTQGSMFCNSTSNTCQATGALRRDYMDELLASGGEKTVFVSGEYVDLSRFIFKNALPENTGQVKVMDVDWVAMRNAYGAARLWFDPTIDATVFGNITVMRVDRETVQIFPDLYNFNLELRDRALRDALTAVQGLRAGSITYGGAALRGSGKPVKIIVVGTTPIRRPN